jgi:AcrR family transcriptional regulator
MAGDGRALRVDAARNHERIVAAAAQAFEDEGPSVSLEEIARRAGVGVATLYRRFGAREQLVRAVLEHVMATDLAPAVVDGGQDPWHDLVATLAATVEAIAAHRVLASLARDIPGGDVMAATSYVARVDRLLSRAQEAGVVRPELTKRDLAAVVVMALSISRMRGHDPAEVRRYLALLADGLRPAPIPLPPGSA